MIAKKNKNLILLVVCIAVSTFVLSGCRSGRYQKPNLDVLKFWKNPDSATTTTTTKVPPPPARYFDPAPILEEQVSQAKAGADETIDLDGQRFTEQFNQSLTQNTDARSLNQLIPETQGSATNAQQEFKAAMQSKITTADPLKIAAKALQKRQEFELPASLKSNNVKPNLNQSLTALNKSIYDANGKLVTNAEQVKASVLNKLNQTKDALPDKADVRDTSLNQFMAVAKEKATQLSPLKPDQFNFKAPPIPESRPVANAFATASAAKTVKPPSFVANLNYQQPAQAAADAQLKLVQAQVADANRQIELLKQQITQATNRPSVSAQIQNPPQTQPPVATPQIAAKAPVAPTAQLQTPRFESDSFSSAHYSKPANTLANVSPTNILRAAQPRTEPASTEAALAFPSTPHGNFSPQGNFSSNPLSAIPSRLNAAPSHSVAPVNFQTNDFQTGGAPLQQSQRSIVSSPQPIANPTANVQKIKSHIPSEIDIPASILNGSGSYAPGSVLQVRQ